MLRTTFAAAERRRACHRRSRVIRLRTTIAVSFKGPNAPSPDREHRDDDRDELQQYPQPHQFLDGSAIARIMLRDQAADQRDGATAKKNNHAQRDVQTPCRRSASGSRPANDLAFCQ